MARLSVPSEFDVEFEAGRARMLRRRFLWLCAVLAGLAVLSLVGMYVSWLTGRLHPRPATFFQLADTLVDLALYLLAAAYAWRSPPKGQALLRIVFWLVVVSGWWSMTTTRVADWLYEAPATGARDYANSALTIILASHFFASLFIRWSVRESLAPGVALLALNVLFVGADVVTGRAGTAAVVYLLLSPLAIVPGVLICWWRYSHFRETFRLQFESARYRLLQAELAGARRVHESCLPAPTTDGPLRLSYVYEPTRQIGGDLIYLHAPQGTGGAVSSFVILDVTGHGIAAALTVNRLVGELERLFAEDPSASPADIIAALDRYIRLTLSRHGIFATAACLRADCDRGTLDWCSGGHPTALLRRADGRIEHLESTAPLLGIADTSEFHPEQRQVGFAAGDAVLCYTDGAPEAGNDDHEQLGTAGMQRLFARCCAASRDPTQWPAALLRDVLSHHGRAPADDTLIAVLFRPPVAIVDNSAPAAPQESASRPRLSV